MTNKDIINLLKLYAKLLELHGANPFKVRGINSGIFALENFQEPIIGLSLEDLATAKIGKSLAEKIFQIIEDGSFYELQELLEKTPEGVLAVLQVKGLGPKKVATLWKEHGIESVDQLEELCRSGELEKLKGFGKKLQSSILEAIEFAHGQKGKFLISDAEELSQFVLNTLKSSPHIKRVEVVGQVRRKLPVVDQLEFLVVCDKRDHLLEDLHQNIELQFQEELSESGPFMSVGTSNFGAKVILRFTESEKFINDYIKLSASDEHLGYQQNEKTLLKSLQEKLFESEEDFYKQNNLFYIAPERREGHDEFDSPEKKVISTEDIKGILHAHSTYSDGKHSLREMAKNCQSLGYQYLGITDHSVSAFYANGLNEERIIEQHNEIELLNNEFESFKIFKGIESDILNDGNLDYSEDILKSFDFIIASIHSNLTMDIEKSMNRLIKAIENPYTTILGHVTGRLLLRREGYPVNHKKIIDACADNGVIIEINANPWRLDIDWKWLSYMKQKGVLTSINPDAHEIAGYHDIQYGLYCARKGNIPKELNLNSMSLSEIEKYFKDRHKN